MHTHGQECCILSCAGSCLAKQTLEKNKNAKKIAKAPNGLCFKYNGTFYQDVAKKIAKAPSGLCFKYNGTFYQDVKKFCNNTDGLKKFSSNARAVLVNTNFPKSDYLVIPGHSSNNTRWVPPDWKNGSQDLSALKSAAYILGQREKPAGTHLLLVAHEQLKRTAASALSSCLRQRKRLRFMHRSNDQENGSGEDRSNV